MMANCRRFLFIAALAACAVGAKAQSVVDRLSLVDGRGFREAFTAAPISGTRGNRTVETLVGLRIGEGSERFDPGAVRVALGGTAAPGQICVRMIARDGRYSASAVYGGNVVARAPAIDAPTRYKTQLAEYSSSDVAISAFVAADCDIAKSVELFVIAFGGAKDRALVLQLNAPASRVRAQLVRADKPVGDQVLCRPIEDGPKIGFTTECRIALAGVSSGLYRLNLAETTSGGASQARSYPLRIVADIDP